MEKALLVRDEAVEMRTSVPKMRLPHKQPENPPPQKKNNYPGGKLNAMAKILSPAGSQC